MTRAKVLKTLRQIIDVMTLFALVGVPMLLSWMTDTHRCPCSVSGLCIDQRIKKARPTEAVGRTGHQMSHGLAIAQLPAIELATRENVVLALVPTD